jgi:hypothetical protein
LGVKPPRIEITVDEVVLHGFAPLDRAAVGLAMEVELARLAGGLALDRVPACELELASSDGGTIRLRAPYHARRVGATVAQAAFRTMNEALQGRTAR